MTTIADGSMRSAIRFLAKTIERSDSNRLPLFNPLSIEYDAGGIVSIRIETRTASMEECLHSLGVALFHLRFGDSQFTKESYRLDGYPGVLECAWGELITRLINRRVTSLAEIKSVIGWKASVKHACNFLQDVFRTAMRTAATRSNAWFQKGKHLVGSLSHMQTFENMWQKMHRFYAQHETLLGFLTAILYSAGGLFVFCFFCATSANTGCSALIFLLIMVLYAVLVIFTFVILFESGIFLRRFHKPWILLSVFAVVQSFILPISFGKSGPTGTAEHTAVVDRGTRKFVAMLPVRIEQRNLPGYWSKWYLNVWKYDVIQGIPSVKTAEWNDSITVGQKTIPIKFKATYTIEPTSYFHLWTTYSSWENIERKLIVPYGEMHTDSVTATCKQAANELAQKFFNAKPGEYSDKMIEWIENAAIKKVHDQIDSLPELKLKEGITIRFSHS